MSETQSSSECSGRKCMGEYWLFLIALAVMVCFCLIVYISPFCPPIFMGLLHPCYLDFVSWKIGDIDLGSSAPQTFEFTYVPDQRDPDIFSIEITSWPEELNWLGSEMPLFTYRISIHKGHKSLWEAEFEGGGRLGCTWHRPNPGIPAMTEDELPEKPDYEPGKSYTVIFQILEGDNLPSDAKGTLYGNFVTERRAPDRGEP